MLPAKSFAKKAALACGIVLSLTSSAWADLSFLEPAHLQETIKNQVAKQDIDVGTNLVNLNIFSGLSSALKYRFQADPSYVNGYYTRIDKYILQTDLKPGDVIAELGLPIGFDLGADDEIMFARQFKTQKESLTALPYTLAKLPMSAKKALELNPGDFVSFKANLSLVLSLGTSAPISPLLNASDYTHFTVSGEFVVNVFRMPGNQVRFKIMANRGRDVGNTAAVSLSGFEVVGISLINNRIKGIIGVTPAQLDMNKANNELFLLDYVFDLSNPQAAQAYDNMIAKKMRFQKPEATNPFISVPKMQDEILTDMTPIQEIVAEDHTLAPSARRIDRVFEGTNDVDTQSSNIQIGMAFNKFEAGSSYSQNQLSNLDRSNQTQKYILDTFSTDSHLKVLFNLLGADMTMTANMLFTPDQNGQPQNFVAMVLSREMKMRNLTPMDYTNLQAHVKSILPPSEYAKIKWDPAFKHLKVNGYFKNTIFFHPEALSQIPNLSQAQLYTLLRNYMIANGRPQTQPTLKLPYGGTESYWVNNYDLDIQFIARNMAVTLNSSMPAKARYESFKQLKDIAVWQERAGGFMLSLIPADQLEKALSYEMTFSAKDMAPISFKFGNFDQEELYNSLTYVQSVINNDNFDLSLFLDKNGSVKELQ